MYFSFNQGTICLFLKALKDLVLKKSSVMKRDFSVLTKKRVPYISMQDQLLNVSNKFYYVINVCI